MTLQAAARLGDEISHSETILGVVMGMLGGACVGVAAMLADAVLIASVPLSLIGLAIVGAATVGISCGLFGILTVLGRNRAADSQYAAGRPDPTTGTLDFGSLNVTFNGRPAVRAGFDWTNRCDGFSWLQHCPRRATVATGSRKVTINGLPAARVEDRLTCGADIKSGSPTVDIGGEEIRVLEIASTREEFLLAFSSRILMGGVHALAFGVLVAIAAVPGLSFVYDHFVVPEEITDFSLAENREKVIADLALLSETELNERIAAVKTDMEGELIKSKNYDYYNTPQHQEFGKMVEYMTGGRISAEDAMSMQPFGGDLGPGLGILVAFGWGSSHSILHDTSGFLGALYPGMQIGPGYGGYAPQSFFSGQVEGYMRYLHDMFPVLPGFY